MSYSAKIKIDRDYSRTDGTNAIFMQVLIDRKKARIDLGIRWPEKNFNEVDLCKARMRNDPDREEYNIIINNARTKANNIHKDYLLRGVHLTMEAFLREYRSDLNKNDFIQFFAQKSYERWNKSLISDRTYTMEKGTLTKLREFKPVIPFFELDEDFAAAFDKHLKVKHSNEQNTRWARHKHIETYLAMARKERINFNDPYARFSYKMTEGKWKPLELDDFKSLLEFYIDWRENPLPLLKKKDGTKQKDERDGLTKPECIVLRRFLFGCNCALRISDLRKNLNRDTFANGLMTVIPHKTEKYGTKITSVPLNDVAQMLLEDELNDNPGFQLFNRYSEGASNRLLKRIAAKKKLKTLHHHMARYTFASLMDQVGANHTGLMKYMGLKKRDTLEKYVRPSDKVIEADIQKMNEAIKV